MKKIWIFMFALLAIVSCKDDDPKPATAEQLQKLTGHWYAELPAKVHLQITWTEPGLKGDTATNTLKPAKVETGAEVRVPLFINEGETVEIDTRDGSYLGRVKA